MCYCLPYLVDGWWLVLKCYESLLGLVCDSTHTCTYIIHSYMHACQVRQCKIISCTVRIKCVYCRYLLAGSLIYSTYMRKGGGGGGWIAWDAKSHELRHPIESYIPMVIMVLWGDLTRVILYPSLPLLMLKRSGSLGTRLCLLC